MKIAFMLVALLLVMPVFAETYTTPAYQDTFISNDITGGDIRSVGTFGNVNFSSEMNYGNLTRLIYTYIYTAGTPADLRTFMKFNNTGFQTRIIDSAKLYMQGVDNSCGGNANKSIYFFRNDGWSNDTLTFDNSGAFGTFPTYSTALAKISTQSGLRNSTDIIATTFSSAFVETIADFYNNTFTTLVFDLNAEGGCGASVGNTANAHSIRFGNNTPFMSYELSDYSTAQITGTGVIQTYFDFESGTASTANYDQADFVYTNTSNAMDSLHGIPNALVGTSLTTDNDLDDVNCGAEGITYSTSSKTSINSLVGSYQIFCFNLSSQHNGHQYYGAVKWLNTSTSVTKFFYALYSPELASFSSFQLNPQPPQSNRNLTVSWQTSRSLTSILYLHYLTESGWSPLITVSNTTSFRTSHSLIVDSSYIVANAYYEYWVAGTSEANASFTSNVLSFTASPFQIQLAGITTGIHILVENEIGTPIKAYVSLDSLQPLQTQTIFANETREEKVEIASFYGMNGGSHNVTVTAPNYRTKMINITVTSEPFFYTTRLTPARGCLQFDVFETNSICESNAASIISQYPNYNITSWYCSFEAGRCAVIQNGVCQQQALGAWAFNGCFDGFHPANFTINGTVNKGQLPSDITGLNSALGTPIGAIFGVSAGSALAMLGLLLSTLGAAAVGFATREGLVPSVVFIGLLSTFTFLGWIPWFIMLIMGIAVAFLIAKFVRQGMTPQ